MENWYRKLANVLKESENVEEDRYSSRFSGSPNKPKVDPDVKYPDADAYTLGLSVKDSKDLPECLRDVASIINKEYAKSADGRFPNDAKRGGFFKDADGKILGVWGIKPKL